jgi:hypothetical protein
MLVNVATESKGGRRNLLDSLEGYCSISNIVHRVKDVSTVILGSAGVACTDNYVFEDYEALLMLEGLALHFLRAHGAFAVFTTITIHRFRVMVKASIEKPVETGCERSGARGPSRKTAGLVTLGGSRVNAAELTWRIVREFSCDLVDRLL